MLITEELVLLAHPATDDGRRLRYGTLDAAVGGAVLADLLLGRHVAVSPRSGLRGPRLQVVGTPTTGHEVLDRAVTSLRLHGPRHPDSLLRKHSVGLVGGVVSVVAGELADVGLLTFGDDGRRRRLTSSWVRPRSSEHAALLARVAHGVAEQPVDLRTAILISLLDAGKQLRHVLPQHDRSVLRARSRELQATLGAAAPIVEAVRRSGRLRPWEVVGLIVDGLSPG